LIYIKRAFPRRRIRRQASAYALRASGFAKASTDKTARPAYALSRFGKARQAALRSLYQVFQSPPRGKAGTQDVS